MASGVTLQHPPAKKKNRVTQLVSDLIMEDDIIMSTLKHYSHVKLTNHTRPLNSHAFSGSQAKTNCFSSFNLRHLCTCRSHLMPKSDESITLCYDH